MSRFSKFITGAWTTYSNHRVKMAEAKARDPQPSQQSDNPLDLASLADLESESLDYADRVKLVFTQTVNLVAPFLLGITLAISNGYFFSGLHDPSFDLPIALAYIGGATLEAIGLAAVYTLNYNIKHSTRKWGIISVLGVILMSTISLIAQYAYLQADKAISVPPGTINRIPALNALVGVGGMQGNDVFFLIRSGAFHIGEVLCALLISRRQQSFRKMLAQQRELHQARIEMQQQALFLDFQRTYAEGFTQFIKSKMIQPGHIAIAEISEAETSGPLASLNGKKAK